MYLGFLHTVVGNSQFPLQPTEPWAPSSRSSAKRNARCTNEKIAYTTSRDACRHFFARKTDLLDAKNQQKICNGKLHVEFVYGGTLETRGGSSTLEYPGIRD